MEIQGIIFRELYSIWPVIVLWSVSFLVVATITFRAIRNFSWTALTVLLRDDSGAAYSFKYVLTLPVYVLFIALFIELSFIMTCKMGTVYAAFAGARVGIVWDSENSESEVNAQVNRAARRAFVPFASGLTQIRTNQASPASNSEVQEYVQTYSEYNKAVQNDRVFQRYVAAKYRYAMSEVKAEIDRSPGPSGDPWDEDFSVTVRYSYPFGTLGIGRAIGQKGPNGLYVFPISTTVTLKTELPQNKDTSLGIDFATIK